MDDRATFAIWYFAIGAIVGVLLGLLRKKGIIYGLLIGSFLNVIGWAFILLGRDNPNNGQESERRNKLTKIARIIVGGLLISSSLVALIAALTSPIPAWENASHVFFVILILVAMTILGVVVLWKGVKRANRNTNPQLENTENETKEN